LRAKNNPAHDIAGLDRGLRDRSVFIRYHAIDAARLALHRQGNRRKKQN
jgi:hypothetical protein